MSKSDAKLAKIRSLLTAAPPGPARGADHSNRWKMAQLEKLLRQPKRPPSRPDRWADATAAALEALNELEELRGEYEEWQGNLPDNLQGSNLNDKLQEVVDLDISGAIETVEAAEGVDLPRGFGKD